MIDKILLAPYYYILRLRHWCYDRGVLGSAKAAVPTICVGNITVGGTGKTPHTEMLIRILSVHPEWKSRNIAVLSRGYKRKSKGFLEVREDGDAAMYGDEPLQIKKKFPEITVAVDKSRTEGCRILTDRNDSRTEKKADIIILDDAFQHRALKPSVSIVLVDYSRPVFKDHLLPLGRLRDLRERMDAADIIIVTKCPPYMEDDEMEEWKGKLGAMRHDAEPDKPQELFFTSIGYDDPVPMWKETDMRYTHSKRLILFSGIADDKPLMRHLADRYDIVRHLTFSDHHDFTSKDILAIEKAVKEYPTAVVVTTEKDSQRMLGLAPEVAGTVTSELKSRMFHIPIRPVFVTESGQEEFVSALDRFI